MADVASLLQASLQPATRKQAEQQLHQLTPQDGFLSHLLQLILNKNVDPSIRLAGGIYLKNIAKLRWEEVSMSLLGNSTRFKHLVTGCRTSAGEGKGKYPSTVGSFNDRTFEPFRQGNSCSDRRVSCAHRRT